MYDVDTSLIFECLQVVTINGARVLSDQQDIWVPQGVAHSIDRVMFPLPVGDLAQTLRADRAKRFNKFIRAINVSGLNMLSGKFKSFND